MISNLRHLFKGEDKDCYKPHKIQTAFNNNYVEYMNNGIDIYQLRNILINHI